MTYRYSHASKTLSQVASMEKPTEWYAGARNPYWHTQLAAYENHLASLKQFPCTGFSETDDQKEFGDGEFELQHQAMTPDTDEWIDFSGNPQTLILWEGFRENRRRIIAVRISKPQEEGM